MTIQFNKEKFLNVINNISTIKEIGRVIEIKGLIIEADGPESCIGDLCYIYKKWESMIVCFIMLPTLIVSNL